jgi:hypothetical protein
VDWGEDISMGVISDQAVLFALSAVVFTKTGCLYITQKRGC